ELLFGKLSETVVVQGNAPHDRSPMILPGSSDRQPCEFPMHESANAQGPRNELSASHHIFRIPTVRTGGTRRDSPSVVPTPETDPRKKPRRSEALVSSCFRRGYPAKPYFETNSPCAVVPVPDTFPPAIEGRQKRLRAARPRAALEPNEGVTN